MMGVVQKLYDQLEREFENVAQTWRKRASVNIDHFKRFNGNNARKLLKKVNVLEVIAPDNKYIEVFRAFDGVVDSCFGEILSDDYKDKIDNFHDAIKEIGIKFTPKIHSVIFHIPEFCELTGRALGFYSEQSSEQVHHDFNIHTNNFYFNLNQADCEQKLLRSICACNSKHIKNQM